MIEKGIVTKIENNYAYVLVKRHSAWGKCKACELGAGDRKEIEIKSVNKADAVIGDNVEIELESPDVLKAAFIVYGIPLIAFFIGFILSYVFTKNELTNLGIGFIFLIISLFFVRNIDKKLAKTKKYDPILVRKL